MRARIPLFLILAGLLSQAAPAAAQVRLIFSPYVGVFFYDDGALAFARGEGDPEDAFDVDPARFIGAKVGIEFLRRLAIEGDFGFASLSGDEVGDIDVGAIEGDLSLYSVGARVSLTPDYPLDVFLTGGIGGATTDFDLQETDSFTDFIVTIGGGASYRLNDHVRLRGDARSIVEFCEEAETQDIDDVQLGQCFQDSSLSHWELSGGVSFSLL